MRNHGEQPSFDAIIEMVQEAKVEWVMGNRGKAERALRTAASLAHGESMELGPHDKPEQSYERRVR